MVRQFMLISLLLTTVSCFDSNQAPVDNNSEQNTQTQSNIENDLDGDSILDEVDPDIDGDGVLNHLDAFERDATEWSDLDLDSIGDNSDYDRDGDNVLNVDDYFPNNPLESSDYDRDGVGDNADLDDDNDGYNDELEIQEQSDPKNKNSIPESNNPLDLDNDGVLNENDAFPYNPSEYLDTDSDSIGNNADNDDDNDLYTDAEEIAAGTDPLDKNDFPNTDPLDVSCAQNVELGEMAYNNGEGINSCRGCHGQIDQDGNSDGLFKFEFSDMQTWGEKGHTGALNNYLSETMAVNVGNCGKECTDNIAAYLLNEVGKPWCPDGNNANDADNDGTENSQDAFPNDPSESIDTDSDGIGNNADLDDDNDQFSDIEELDAGTDPLNINDFPIVFEPIGEKAPVRIESENFTDYIDNTLENVGNCGPQQEVDLQPAIDSIGNCDVGWIQEGEWLSYNFYVEEQADYEFLINLASNSEGKTMTVSISGDINETIGDVQAPAEGWVAFKEVSAGHLVLEKGNYKLKVLMNSGGQNLNYIRIKLYDEFSQETPINDPSIKPDGYDDYVILCANCHGSDGMGDRSLNQDELNDTQMIHAIVNDMPPSNKAACLDECALNITHYIRNYLFGDYTYDPNADPIDSLPLDGVKASLGYDQWIGKCAACHGGDGTGVYDQTSMQLENGIDMSIWTRSKLIQKIEATMPPSPLNPEDCENQCAENVTEYMLSGFFQPDVENGGLVSCEEDDAILHGNTPIRLLNTQQYRNLISNTFNEYNLNVNTLIKDELLLDLGVGGFSNNAGIAVDSDSFSKIFDAAENIAQSIRVKFVENMNCSKNKECVTQFVEEYGRLLFKRTLTESEINTYSNIWDFGENNNQSLDMVVTALLIAPQTLYQIEEDVDTRKKLSGTEIASKLSFLIWNTGPDDLLIEAAESGELNTKQGILTQTQRLMNNEKSIDGLRFFYSNILNLEKDRHIDNLQPVNSAIDQCDTTAQCKTQFSTATDCKNSASDESICMCGSQQCQINNPDILIANSQNNEIFKATSAQIEREILKFANHLTYESNGTYEDLMTSRTAFVDEDIANIYGVDIADATQAQLQNGFEVQLNSEQRSGLLTRIAYTIYGTQNNGAVVPTTRGAQLRETILCQHIPSPPAGAAELFPEAPDLTQTTWVQHLKDIHLNPEITGQSCKNCHELMDPIGFAFENYSAFGNYIETYDANSLSVNSEGYFVDIAGQPIDIMGGFSDAVELSEMIATSNSAQECFAKKWYVNAMSREVSDQEYCAFKDFADEFVEQDLTLKELIIELVQSDVFRFRNPE